MQATDLIFTPAIDPSQSSQLQNAVVEVLVKRTGEIVQKGIDHLSKSGMAMEPLAQTLSAFQALESLPTPSRHQIVLHPSFNYWLQAVRRLLAQVDPNEFSSYFSRLPEFVWLEQVKLGSLQREWLLSTDEFGGLRCPGSGIYIELGKEYALQPVRLSPAMQSVVLVCNDGLRVQIPIEEFQNRPAPEEFPTIDEHGYEITRSCSVGEGIEVTTRDPWLRVRITGTNQRTSGTVFFGSDESVYPQSFSVERLSSALTTLAEYWQFGYGDIGIFTRAIVPVKIQPQNGNNFAFTVSSRQGAVYIGDADVFATVEMLLHENAHVKLRQVQILDTLLKDPLDESVKVQVPWRPDPRPIPGVFEGVFVFSHIAEFHRLRWTKDADHYSRDRVRVLARDLGDAIKAIEISGSLTETGWSFLSATKEWCNVLN